MRPPGRSSAIAGDGVGFGNRYTLGMPHCERGCEPARQLRASHNQLCGAPLMAASTTRELTPAELEQRGQAALKHGGSSEHQIVLRSTVEKRRLLRQLGIRQSDLASVGRALVLNWSRAAAALALMDDYAARHGWLDADGEPRGFARLYVSLLNAERLALRALADHLRDASDDPFERLSAHLAAKEGERP